MAESLLDKAKSSNVKNNNLAHITPEHIELALAWANDEIGTQQVSEALGKSGSSTYVILARALKGHIKMLSSSSNVDHSSDKQKGPE